MTNIDRSSLTERQIRELEYHREHAANHRSLLTEPIGYDVVEGKQRRWWNAYWTMWRFIAGEIGPGARVLVPGCGFGHDALRLAKHGCEVHAVDMSEESLEICRALSRREKLPLYCKAMPVESLDYPEDNFDCIVARDILHHVDLPRTLDEFQRVLKPGGLLIVNEIYTHRRLQHIRDSRFVRNNVYPRLVRRIYGTDKPYITEDEQKLNEEDIAAIVGRLDTVHRHDYFNMLVKRFVSGKSVLTSKVDRILLRACGPWAGVFGGRVLVIGTIGNLRSTG